MFRVEYLVPGLMVTIASFIYVYSAMRARSKMQSVDDYLTVWGRRFVQNTDNMIAMGTFWILTLTAPFLSAYLLTFIFMPLDLNDVFSTTYVGFGLSLIIGILAPFRFKEIEDTVIS